MTLNRNHKPVSLRVASPMRSGLTAVTFPLACCVLVGCTSHHPYAEEFDEVRAATESEFVRSVLDDDEITPDEFEEALNSTITCMENAGLHPIIGGDGHKRFAAIPADEDDEDAAEACWEQWDGGITSLFTQTHENPNNVAWYDLIAACLVHEGLVPPDTTGENVEEVWSQTSTTIHVDGDGVETTLAAPTNLDPAFPNGFHPFSDDSRGCLDDPRGVIQRSGGEAP